MEKRVYEYEGRKVPTDYVESMMEKYGISDIEAVTMYAEDEGWTDNEEVRELEQKAKVNKISHEAKATTPKKKTPRERVQKENPTKEKVIAETAKLLEEFATNVVIENKTKIITFEIEGKQFKFDLIEKRKPKT